MNDNPSKKINPIIIAGGSGTRLWPISRESKPKQFLNLINEDSLLQQTINRLSGLPINRPMTVCSKDHRFFVAEQLRQIGVQGTILLEPLRRNTAPAISLAAFLQKDLQSLMLVLPADHVILDVQKLQQAIKDAMNLASDGYLVTFGLKPTQPHTGYGYIKTSDKLELGYKVDSFVEKPDFQTASLYFESGEYFWNSGMFLFRADSYLEELKLYRKEIYTVCDLAIKDAVIDEDFIRINSELFEQCPSESIDFAVMENTNKAAMIEIECDWSDVGSWSSLWDISPKDDSQNVTKGDVVLSNCSNSLIYTDDKLVTAVGLDNLVVVSTRDAVFVCDKLQSQSIGKIVDTLKQADRKEWNTHAKVYRPWGCYETIDQGSRYQVKRITVYPGEKLSVQLHHHRAEHWVVVSGSAKITIGDKTLILTENQYTYIPVGEVHSLENPGKLNLELIEVQSGAYLGEDDIVRLSDIYGRDKS